MLTKSDVIHIAKRIVQCEECGSRKLCFANIFNEQEKQIFNAFISHVLAYSKGQHLFHAGEKVTELFILKSGSAKSYLVSEDGDEQVIGFHYPGEVLGLDDLSRDFHTSSVIFLEDAKVCAITKTACKDLAQKMPQLSQEIIGRLNMEINHAHQLQLLTNHLTAEQRIAAFILELSERMNLIGLPKASFNLSMPRSDIANYLGLATETASRLFKKLERDSLIEVKNKYLHILDFSGLSKRTHTCDKCSVVLINGKYSTSN